MLENMQATAKLDDTVKDYEAICKKLSEQRTITKVANPASAQNPSAISKKALSIEIVLSDLFKIAMNAFEKEEFDHLNNEALALFEQLDAYVEKTKKFPMSKMQAKIFKALDSK